MNITDEQTDDIYLLFNSLEGEWQFERLIDYHGKATGLTHFTRQSANQLLYKEQGVYFANTGSQFNIFREYLYSYENRQITVYFLEGHPTPRMFYTLQMQASNHPVQATATHLCNRDIYEATYTFSNANQFSLYYHITGPAKNYRIATQYHR